MAVTSKTSQYLADNIVSLRGRRALSQEGLAKIADIPRSTLANIESGSGNPSLQNLVRLSTALQVGIEELLSRPRNECELLDEEKVPVYKRHQGKVRIYKIVPEKVRGVAVERLEIDPGATMTGHPHLAGAKEYLSVLQGEIIVSVAGESFSVKRGAVLAFPGDQPHSYRNSGASMAIAISAIIPVTIGFD